MSVAFLQGEIHGPKMNKWVEIDLKNKKSDVWKHFLKNLDSGQLRCKICQKNMGSGTSCTTLKYHLEELHKIHIDKVYQEAPKAKESQSQSLITDTFKPKQQH